MAMMGEIRLFAFDHEPEGWLFCDGRLLDGQKYPALHALLAPEGKGNQPAFLPDLRGRALAHAGQTNDGVMFNFARHLGTATETLSVAHLPAHRHAFVTFASPTFVSAQQNLSVGPKAGLSRLTACFHVQTSGGVASYEMWVPTTTIPTKMMAVESVGEVGGGDAHDNMSPYLSLNYCICAVAEAAPVYA